MAFEILATGVLFFECIFKSRMFSLVHATRLPCPFDFVRLTIMVKFFQVQVELRRSVLQKQQTRVNKRSPLQRFELSYNVTNLRSR
jgi:hypothetical protein